MLFFCGCDLGPIILRKNTDKGHNIGLHKHFVSSPCSCMVVAGGLLELRCEDRSGKFFRRVRQEYVPAKKKIWTWGGTETLLYVRPHAQCSREQHRFLFEALVALGRWVKKKPVSIRETISPYLAGKTVVEDSDTGIEKGTTTLSYTDTNIEYKLLFPVFPEVEGPHGYADSQIPRLH
jgi:hypothetical protein